jgi:molybdate transport system ATP-binding protein
LADTLVLLNAGHVVAAGPIEQIATRSDLPIALRDDAGAILTATVQAHDQARQLTRLQAGGLVLWVPLMEREPGAQLRVRLPAREVILAAHDPGPTSVHNVIAGHVRAITQLASGHAALVEAALDGTALLARVTADAVDRLGLAPGRDVLALVKSVSIEVLPG